VIARSPDRELRRHILRLRSLAANDFDIIVDGLDDTQREAVLKLLDDLEGRSETAAPEATAPLLDPVTLPPDLSPWLVARVNGQGDSGEETADPFTITAFAQQALRRCAAEMVPQKQEKAPSPSLLDRLWQGISQ
jgi:hypothetical protein